jgi:hypothetical protein
MSQETFTENRPAILVALQAVVNNPKSRKRFRLLAVYERVTGELLAEVFGTIHGPVIIHRSWGTILSRSSHNTEFTRQGRSNIVVAPLTDNPNQKFHIVAHNTRYTFRCEELRRWIAEGKTRHTVP